MTAFLAIALDNTGILTDLPHTGGGGGTDWVLPAIVAAIIVLLVGLFLARRSTPR